MLLDEHWLDELGNWTKECILERLET